MIGAASFPAPLAWFKARFGGRQMAASQAERRSTQRQRMRFEAEIQRLDGSIPVVGVNLQEDGALVLSKQAWAKGTVLFLKLKDVQLGGFAEVRHCTLRKEGKYAIGLAFRGPLVPQGETWQIQRVCQPENVWTANDDGPFPCDKPREAA
jgi:hypothetical protein